MTPTDPAVPSDENPPSAPTWAPALSTATPGPPLWPSLAGMLAATAVGPLAMALTGAVGIVVSFFVLSTVLYLGIRLRPRGYTGEWGPRSWSWKPFAVLAIPLMIVFAISAIAFQESDRTWWVPIAVGAVVAVLVLIAGVFVSRKRAQPRV
jgi:hypothetical protein